MLTGLSPKTSKNVGLKDNACKLKAKCFLKPQNLSFCNQYKLVAGRASLYHPLDFEHLSTIIISKI